MSDKDKPDIYDVVVLGAGDSRLIIPIGSGEGANMRIPLGLYGIQAARCYLDIHPTAKLVILEGDDVVGGTWSSSMSF